MIILFSNRLCQFQEEWFHIIKRKIKVTSFIKQKRRTPMYYLFFWNKKEENKRKEKGESKKEDSKRKKKIFARLRKLHKYQIFKLWSPVYSYANSFINKAWHSSITYNIFPINKIIQTHTRNNISNKRYCKCFSHQSVNIKKPSCNNSDNFVRTQGEPWELLNLLVYIYSLRHLFHVFLSTQEVKYCLC